LGKNSHAIKVLGLGKKGEGDGGVGGFKPKKEKKRGSDGGCGDRFQKAFATPIKASRAKKTGTSESIVAGMPVMFASVRTFCTMGIAAAAMRITRMTTPITTSIMFTAATSPLFPNIFFSPPFVLLKSTPQLYYLNPKI